MLMLTRWNGVIKDGRCNWHWWELGTHRGTKVYLDVLEEGLLVLSGCPSPRVPEFYRSGWWQVLGWLFFSGYITLEEWISYEEVCEEYLKDIKRTNVSLLASKLCDLKPSEDLVGGYDNLSYNAYKYRPSWINIETGEFAVTAELIVPKVVERQTRRNGLRFTNEEPTVRIKGVLWGRVPPDIIRQCPCSLFKQPVRMKSIPPNPSPEKIPAKLRWLFCDEKGRSFYIDGEELKEKTRGSPLWWLAENNLFSSRFCRKGDLEIIGTTRSFLTHILKLHRWDIEELQFLMASLNTDIVTAVAAMTEVPGVDAMPVVKLALSISLAEATAEYFVLKDIQCEVIEQLKFLQQIQDEVKLAACKTLVEAGASDEVMCVERVAGEVLGDFYKNALYQGSRFLKAMGKRIKKKYRFPFLKEWAKETSYRSIDNPLMGLTLLPLLFLFGDLRATTALISFALFCLPLLIIVCVSLTLMTAIAVLGFAGLLVLIVVCALTVAEEVFGSAPWRQCFSRARRLKKIAKEVCYPMFYKIAFNKK